MQKEQVDVSTYRRAESVRLVLQKSRWEHMSLHEAKKKVAKSDERRVLKKCKLRAAQNKGASSNGRMSQPG